MPVCSIFGQMKAAADLVKGVVFGFEKRDAGIKSLACGILEENQYNARGTKVPQIGLVTPGSKYWDELIEKINWMPKST